ncbi:hypothetical protein [Streptomyces sp. NBC_01438]|uniref:hypothetical protein n=1 Tax=Streptomyces sp. NBC_01438 TaxID=2903866 RepID=UPI0032569300
MARSWRSVSARSPIAAFFRRGVRAYGREAVGLARASASGYVARRLRALCDEFGPLSRDHRVAELGAEIATLSTP